MSPNSSRRGFLAAGLALPAAAPATSGPQAATQAPPKGVKLAYRTLGKTGLKLIFYTMMAEVVHFQQVAIVKTA